MSKGTAESMRAIQIHHFGGPEVLIYGDVPRPVPGPGEVLIRVYAAGVNPGDWKLRQGKSRGNKISLPVIPGWDVSGIVEEIGQGVTAFKKGDAVYGLVRFPSPLGGAYAEYMTAPAAHLAHKPLTIDHIQAASVPMAALTAWQALFEHAKLGPAQTVLVNGAAGGVGHFAVQLAKANEDKVIGVASGRHEQFLRELGVDQFIDYTATPLEAIAENVDLIIDLVGGENGYRLLHVLKQGGTLVSLVHGNYSLDHATGESVETTTVHSFVQVRSNGTHLDEIGRFIDEGKVHVAIDSVFPLAEARKAHERSEKGHVRGKIVLQVCKTV